MLINGSPSKSNLIWRYKEPKENELENTKESIKNSIVKHFILKNKISNRMKEVQKERWNG